MIHDNGGRSNNMTGWIAKRLIKPVNILRRFAFTLVTLLIIILVAVITGTHLQKISEEWLHLMGFAPQDVWVLRLETLILSALVTAGKWTFLQALLMIILGVGWAEWKIGTAKTALLFWVGHLVTLLSEALLIIPVMKLFHLPLGHIMAVARDIGPSAGYYCCFGLVVAKLPSKWRLFALVIMCQWLMISFYNALFAKVLQGADISASVAHLVAFVLGWVAAYSLFRGDSTGQSVPGTR